MRKTTMKLCALVPVFALILATGFSGCASLSPSAAETRTGTPLLQSDADYARLGLDRSTVAVWEDGRRTTQDPSHYEWWYFDGLLDDGTVIVAWLGDNWAFGSRTRNVSLEVTPPGEVTRRFQKSYVEPGFFSREKAEVRFGPHSFTGDLASYRIVVDAADSGGLGIDMVLRSLIAPWRPGTGRVESQGLYFAWLVAVPNGSIEGTLTIDGAAREVRGSGYHDHNWGNVSPAAIMTSWWWGRAVVGDRTVIVSELRARKALAPAGSGGRGGLFYVGSPRGVEVDAHLPADIRVVEGPAIPHPDPRHLKPIGSSVTFVANNGYEVVFPVSDRFLTSADLLDGQNWGVRALAAVAGLKPWYTRFFSEVSLTVPAAEQAEAEILKGAGTLEYIEFQ
jgi:hypothetical protein